MHRGSVRAIAAIGVLIALAAAVLAVVSDVHVGVALGVRLPVAPGWINAAIGVAFSVSGAVLLWRAGPHPVAVVLAGAGVPVALLGAACGWVNLSAVTWRTAPAVDVALAGVERFGVLPVIVLPIALTFFPDARLPAGRPWRWSSVAGVVLLVGGVLVEALVPTPIAHAGFGGLDPRVRTWSRDWGIPLPEGVWEALLPAVPGLIVAGVVFALVGLVGRYPNGSARLRRQLRWILWAALVFLGCLLFGVFSQLW